MIHERRTSAHTHHPHLALVREYREQEPVIAPSGLDMRRVPAPRYWPPEDDYPGEGWWREWAERHPRAAYAITVAVVLAFGLMMGIVIGGSL